MLLTSRHQKMAPPPALIDCKDCGAARGVNHQRGCRQIPATIWFDVMGYTMSVPQMCDLLGAVKSLEVWRESDGTSNLYLRQVFGMSDPWREVTVEIITAERAGLVRVVEGRNGTELWQLTKRGEKMLRRRGWARWFR